MPSAFVTRAATESVAARAVVATPRAVACRNSRRLESVLLCAAWQKTLLVKETDGDMTIGYALYWFSYVYVPISLFDQEALAHAAT